MTKPLGMNGKPSVRLDDFSDDAPWDAAENPLKPFTMPHQIEGVRLARLVSHGDDRGELTVLHTRLGAEPVLVPHVYLVWAKPRSIRAWVYHKRQDDRLAYPFGSFRVVLYDIRPGSATYGRLNILEVGSSNPVQLVIPAFVVHGVMNLDDKPGFFLNMPSNAYDRSMPDKSRLPWDHPGIPYRFA